MRIHIAATLFGCAVLAAACGGGGKSGMIPTAGTAPGAPTTTGQTTHATISLYVPPPARQASRHPLYISSNTQSFGVVVVATPLASPPSPAQAQIFPVATPSPCVTASGGGYSCTLVVTAPLGQDYFYVAAFPQASPGATAVPISEYMAGPITIGSSPSPGASPLSFSLNAVANTVAVTVPSPDPGNTPNTQVFTAGLASQTYPLGIVAYDSSNNIVLSDPTTVFASPVVVTVSPASAGVGLILNGTCPSPSPVQAAHKRERLTSFPGGPASVSITCAADLSNVSFGYTGITSPDPNDHITDTFTISASQVASPGPSPANVVLASSIQTWQLASIGNPLSAVYLLPMSTGPFLYLATNSNGTMAGTFDPASQTVSASTALNGAGELYGAAIAPFGNLWTNNSGPLDCYASVAQALAGAAPSPSGLYPVAPNDDVLYPTNITVDSAGNVWYVALDEGVTTYAGYFSTASGCSTSIPNPIVAQFSLTGDTGDQYPTIVPLPGGGVAIQTGESSVTPALVYTLTTNTASGNVSPAATMTLANGIGWGLAADAAGTLYAAAADDATAGNIETLASGASTFDTLLGLPPTPQGSFPFPQPYTLSAYSPNGTGAADRLMYNDAAYTAFGLIEDVPAAPLPILVSLPNAYDVLQGAYTTDGAEYVPYVDNSFNLQLARVLPTTTWSVPNLQVAAFTCNTSDALLTVLERGDSGPFSVNITGTSGVTSTPLPGADHDAYLTVPGSYPAFTATITDNHGRSQSVAVTTLSSNGYNCGIAHRRNLHAPRTFRKPPGK
jgi:hypothetical protein